MALDVLAVQAPLNPTLMVHLRGRAIGKVAWLNVDSSGADHKHSSKTIQNAQSVYRMSKMGRSALLTQKRVRPGSPRIRCRGKTDLFGEMSESNSTVKCEESLTQAK